MYLGLSFLWIGCGSSEDTATELSAIDRAWAEYDIQEPGAETVKWLRETPWHWPEEVCIDIEDIEVEIPEETQLSETADGRLELCVNDFVTANVPEGFGFTDLLSCNHVYTQGPPWFAKPERVYESEDSLLDDPAYVEEANWVADQVLTSGCACCHSSGSGSDNVSGFDSHAPGVWTDTMENFQLAMFAGFIEDSKKFGHYDPADNHGFDRSVAMYASTDTDRMTDFFISEFERRGGTQEDIDEAQRRFDSQFGRFDQDPTECIDPFEGLIDGKLTWNGDGARQIDIMETDAKAPTYPPNLHLPEGTIWAVFLDVDGTPMESGTVSPGVLPEGAKQYWPIDDSEVPVLESGKTYKLFVTPDAILPWLTNCTFTYAE